jgi:hypothetical protein
MNSKDLIKYGLIALGAYLIYEYIQKNGGLSGIFGTTAAAGGTGTGTTLTSNGVAALNAMLNQESVASFNSAQIAQLALTPAQVAILNGAMVTDRVSADALMNQLGISSQQLAFIRSTNISPVVGGTQTVTPPVAILDTSGLVVVPDINDSLTGVVQINGVPTKLSIITASGQIYDGTGTEVTSALQAEGIDVVALRTAFQNAAPPNPNLPPAPHPGLPCVQPNFFNPVGVCVSGNTQDGTYGQPVPGAAPRGVSGLGRVTPYWLM